MGHPGWHVPYLDESLFPGVIKDFGEYQNYEAAKQAVVERFQKDYINAILRLTGGNISQAAERMGISRQGLQKMMKALNLHLKSE